MATELSLSEWNEKMVGMSEVELSELMSRVAGTTSSPFSVIGSAVFLIAAVQTKYPSVTAQACAAINTFSAGNEARKLMLFDLSAAELLTKAIGHFGLIDAKVAENASFAIGNLAMVEKIVQRLESLGASWAVAQAMRANKSSAAVAQKGSFAIAILLNVEAGRKAKQIKKEKIIGIANILVDAIRNHKTNALVAKFASWAVAKLASGQGNTSKNALGAAGACEVIVQALLLHGLGAKKNSGVAEKCCSAIHNLAVNCASNRAKLGKAGACEAVAEAIQAFDSLNYIGANTMGWLAFSNAENKKALRIAGAMTLIRDIFKNRVENVRALTTKAFTDHASRAELIRALGNLEALSQDLFDLVDDEDIRGVLPTCFAEATTALSALKECPPLEGEDPDEHSSVYKFLVRDVFQDRLSQIGDLVDAPTGFEDIMVRADS